MSVGGGRHILIAGAGLAGSLLACYLSRRGFRVSVYERRPDPRAKGFAGGRSINLALSTRGITGLAGVGLDGPVLEAAIPMRGRMMHDTEGRLTFQRYSVDPSKAINSVSRGGLNVLLLDAAEASEGVTLRFGVRCEEVDLDAPAAVFRDEATGEVERVEADALIGADGAFSAVRGRMQKTDRFDYSQSYLDAGYKELTIPAAEACGVDPSLHDGYALDPHALHIWPRGGSMMIALPNRDRSFTCTLFWPYGGDHGFDALRTGEEVRAHFERWYPDAVPLMPTLVEDYLGNPTSSLVTVRCWPWVVGGKAALIGDACHAIVPFYGQGMNAAFEDCRVLASCVDEHAGDLEAAFDAYQRARKPNADAIADLALANFEEMRDKVASPVFLLRKKAEKALARLFPGRYTPLYDLVSFSNVPYAEAVERERRQNRLVATAAIAVGVALVLVASALVLSWLGAGPEEGSDAARHFAGDR